NLKAIEQRFSARYERFEERLQKMVEYIRLQPGQNRCRSAYLVNYLTGRNHAPPCGKCDLCSPTSESLPWRPDVELITEVPRINPRMAVFSALRAINRLIC